GRGIGRKLYTALLENARKQGIHVVIGGIALPNPESVILHEKMDFEKVAQFKEVGFKHNQWLDVGYWELMFPSGQSH
ncbi:MAG TPA: GNAT family N-acetyltransferase, partial [Bacteroidales bacterium]|nr:GNAT family N-acetyltransferase [Bacteroidales bacterium]